MTHITHFRIGCVCYVKCVMSNALYGVLLRFKYGKYGVVLWWWWVAVVLWVIPTHMLTISHKTLHIN